MVWPWWLRNSVTTSRRPVAAWAILTAPSFAVAPPETFRCTLVSASGETSTSRRTSSFTGSAWNEEVTWTSRSVCSRTAAITSGCP